jgi:hypothetical protein
MEEDSAAKPTGVGPEMPMADARDGFVTYQLSSIPDRPLSPVTSRGVGQPLSSVGFPCFPYVTRPPGTMAPG